MAKRKRVMPPAFSLFSFQDIISCVMGIMILVTLILALEVIDGGEAKLVSDVQDRISANREIITQLQAEVDRMKSALDQAVFMAEAVIGLDPIKLAEDIEVQRSKIEELENRLANQISIADNLQRQILQANQDLAAKTAEKERQAFVQQQQAAAAESRLKTILQSDVLVFRDPPKRELLIIEVTRDGYLAAHYNKVQSPVVCGTLDELSSYLDGNKALNPVVYFVVKPSGTENFQVARKVVQNRDMFFSFTLVGEYAIVIDRLKGHIH